MATKPTNHSPEQPNEPTVSAKSGREFRLETPAEIIRTRVYSERAGIRYASEPLRARAAEALTEEQRDGLACVMCSRDFTTYSGPTLPVATVNGAQVFACVDCDDVGSETLVIDEGVHGVDTPAGETEPVEESSLLSPVAPTPAMWPAGEPASVRQAAAWVEITAQIREVAEMIRPVVDDRYGDGTGALLVELVDALLAGRIEVERFTSLSEALQRGDLAAVEQAVSR